MDPTQKHTIYQSIMISSASNTNTYSNCFFIILLVLCLCFHICSSKDNITTGEIFRDGTDYLESSGNIFRMGFFSPQTGSKQRYLGIWYVNDPKTVVWVANRNNPVSDFSGVLTITKEGLLQVLDKDQGVHFYMYLGRGASQMALKLLDSGNSVLSEIDTGTIRWQSFDYPTDTFLPGMIMNYTSNNIGLTSWKSADDPSTGSFVFQQEQDSRRYIIVNSSFGVERPHWTLESPESTFRFEANTSFHFKVAYLLSNNSIRSYEIGYSARLLMSYTGNLQYYIREKHDKQWSLEWQAPEDNCSIYDVCGNMGMCSLVSNNIAKCTCLQGFEPVSPKNSSAGCKRRKDSCDNKNDKFINLTMISVENPVSSPILSINDSECKNSCLRNCDCKAYSYDPNYPVCWIWDSELNNLRSDGIRHIFIRVSKGDLNQSFITETRILIFVLTILVISLLCGASYFYYKRRVTRQQENNERWAIELLDLGHSGEENTESIGIPFFQLEDILIATDNFADANKLGEGGFGPVYKGKLPSGLVVAVKRLSQLSGQGLEEFRNEVTLIAKLQHRNLVRLLGYSMKGNEKALLYEYMLNKILDAFIFDRTPSITLDWPKRYEIILGIVRGLLYLHQDSRLRIIHRDMKTSNILLDEELNPKISDFGLAKIVQGRNMEVSTNRVIGTYGYMAPEYALDGLFSIKSDVFSFRVVVLEIISGKKNTGSPQFQHNIGLLGYAWNLWKEDRSFELMDQKLLESSNSSEVLKCIIIGLLCVQEDPGERPTMTNVVLMLASDITSLPIPKQPAFVARNTMSSSSSSYKPDQSLTNNSLTNTLEGR